MQNKSNLAYDISAFEQRTEPVIKRVPSNRKAVKSVNIAKAVVYMVFIVALLCALIYGRVVQSEVDAKLTASTKQLSDLKAENGRLHIKIESVVSLDKIEEIATTQLGLNKINNQQIEYVNINKENKIEVLGSKTLWQTIVSWFK